MIGLTANGHKGPITMHSRTGALPSVRGTQGRYKPSILTPETVRSCISRAGVVRLEDVLRWAMQELALEGKPIGADWSTMCSQRPALEFLEAEIAAARHPRFWQSVLYSTNAVLDLIWPAMPDEDKKRFLGYSSWWMAYRVSIPIENALKIKSLVETGQLSIIKGELQSIEYNGRFTLKVAKQSKRYFRGYDAVVVATGTPRDVTKFDNLLVQNIIQQGIGCVDPFGGLKVSAESGGLINQSGYVDDRITVLGELTSGALFFTSALEINSRHSTQRAEYVLARLAQTSNAHFHSLKAQLLA